MNYESARAFADTWGLILLAAIFVLLIVWLFRRGSSKKYEKAARIPMEAPEHPEAAPPAEGDDTTHERREGRPGNGDRT